METAVHLDMFNQNGDFFDTLLQTYETRNVSILAEKYPSDFPVEYVLAIYVGMILGELLSGDMP